MTTKSSKLCAGCSNNYSLDETKIGCWKFHSAALVERKILGNYSVPPFTEPTQTVLSCYEKYGYQLVEPGELNEKGFWK